MEVFGVTIPCAFARYREERMQQRDSNKMKAAARRFVVHREGMNGDGAPEAGAGL
jgi:hypothetical protein